MTTVSDYSISDCAVCIGGTPQAKAAALYFDHILPLMYGECPESVVAPACYDEEVQHAIVFADMTILPSVPERVGVGALPINQVLVHVLATL